MKRLTDKEWITTKHFQNLNADEVLRRLWELENEVESGKYVELPKDKWAITVGGDKNAPNYMIEHRNPIAEYFKGKWHIDFEIIEWRHILCEYDTKPEAEAKLKELKGEKE